MEHSVNNFDYSKPIQRELIFELLTTALNQREFRFVRQASLMWLAAYPGDYKINYLLARALLLESKTSQSLPILKKINATDPEYLPAVQALTDHPNADTATISNARTDAYILDETTADQQQLPGLGECHPGSPQAAGDRRPCPGRSHPAIRIDPEHRFCFTGHRPPGYLPFETGLHGLTNTV